MKRFGVCLVAAMVGLIVVAFADATSPVFPTSDIQTTSWTAAGAGTFYSEIDESGAHDDDTTYIETTTNNVTYVGGVSGITIPDGATIDSVVVTVVAKEITADAAQRLRVRSGTSLFSCAAGTQQLTTSYASYSCTWTTNPADAAAWEEAEIEGGGTNPLTGIGVLSQDIAGGETVRVTQLSVVVNYTGGGGAPPRRPCIIGSGFYGPQCPGDDFVDAEPRRGSVTVQAFAR